MQIRKALSVFLQVWIRSQRLLQQHDVTRLEILQHQTDLFRSPAAVGIQLKFNRLSDPLLSGIDCLGHCHQQFAVMAQSIGAASGNAMVSIKTEQSPDKLSD